MHVGSSTSTQITLIEDAASPTCRVNHGYIQGVVIYEVFRVLVLFEREFFFKINYKQNYK